nr:four helix bundle protein [Gramella sp. KN1008]
MILIDNVYLKTKRFPRDEIYGLTSQFRRASTSIALNRAEGAGSSNSEFKRYLQIAMNSVKESVVCNEIAFRQKYIDENDHQKFRNDLTELSKMLTALKKYLVN